MAAGKEIRGKIKSVETTMTPTAFASFTFMNACVYSGFALPRLLAMLRTLSL